MNNNKTCFKDLISIYPSDEYNYALSSLLGQNKIKISDYLEIINEYAIANEYLHIYEKYCLKEFSITWAQSHIHSIVPEMKKPTKKEVPAFDNESGLTHLPWNYHLRGN